MQGRGIGNIDPGETEIAVGRETLEARPLERGVVIVIEVVDADHLVAALEQQAGDVQADEAGGTGDQDFHRGRPIEKYSKPCARIAAGS